MNAEEIERTMDFILRCQAQFSVDLQTLSGHTLTLVDQVEILANIVQQEHADRIHDQSRTEAVLATLAELVEIQSRRLDRLEGNLPS